MLYLDLNQSAQIRPEPVPPCSYTTLALGLDCCWTCYKSATTATNMITYRTFYICGHVNCQKKHQTKKTTACLHTPNLRHHRAVSLRQYGSLVVSSCTKLSRDIEDKESICILPFDLAEDVDSTQQNVGYLRHEAENIKEVNLVDRRGCCCIGVGHVDFARWRHWRQLVMHEILYSKHHISLKGRSHVVQHRRRTWSYDSGVARNL